VVAAAQSDIAPKADDAEVIIHLRIKGRKDSVRMRLRVDNDGSTSLTEPEPTACEQDQAEQNQHHQGYADVSPGHQAETLFSPIASLASACQRLTDLVSQVLSFGDRKKEEVVNVF
jgi:hypothetical protein